jgi:hypothetical protein
MTTPNSSSTAANTPTPTTPQTRIAAIVEEMLNLYGVKFTDANSREVCVKSWAEHFLASAQAAQPSTEDMRRVLSAAKQWADNDAAWKSTPGPAYFKTNMDRAEYRSELRRSIERIAKTAEVPHV